MDEAFAHVEGSSPTIAKKGTAPPDGGWGYMVCIGVGFTFMLGFGSSNAFGILFHNFFMEQGGASGLPLVIGVYNGALSIAGFLSGIALKKYSFRQVGLVGAGLFVLGDVLTIFVQKTYQLVFTFGVVRGAGFGVMIPVSFTAFNCYFTRKRTAMMSANQSMSSMASITFPMLVTFLLVEYGFRWTLALIMAMDLHLVFAMLVMHPVEWHMIRGNCDPESSINCEVQSINKMKYECNDESTVKMLPGEDNTVENKDKDVKTRSRHESIQKNILKTIYKNVELDLLKDPRFVSTLIGLGFAFVSDVTYLAMEPMLLFSYGFSKMFAGVKYSGPGVYLQHPPFGYGIFAKQLSQDDGLRAASISGKLMQVATCVMVGAIADLLARFALAIFTYFYTVDSRKIFFVGTCITVVLRIALVSSSDINLVFAVTAISGLVRCSVQVLFPLVLVTAAPNRFPAALALHILFSGCLMLMADPLIGVIFEATGSYVYCFLAMSFCCFVCVVLWVIEYIMYRDNKS